MKTIKVYVVTDKHEGTFWGVHASREEAEKMADQFDHIEEYEFVIPQEIQVQRDY